MSGVKRGLQLSSAIVSIVLGSLFVFAGMIILFWGQVFLDIMASNSEAYDTLSAGIMSFVGVVIIILGIGIILVNAFMCPNPNKKTPPATYKGLMITSLTINAILVFGELVSLSWYAVFPLIPLGLMIAALCVSDETENKPIAQTQQQTHVTEMSNFENQAEAKEGKIEANKEEVETEKVENQ